MDEAVDLCRMSADEGIDTIVATPHVLRGRWKNTSRAQLETKLAELREQVGDAPRLLLGSEYFFAHDVAEVMRGGAIIPLAGSRYILVEFASNAIPPLVLQPLHAVMLDGWTPIIAHPERLAGGSAAFAGRSNIEMLLQFNAWLDGYRISVRP